jgi:3-methyl-2-indolic acid synthase
MTVFGIEPASLAERRARAAARAEAGEGRALAAALRAGERLDDESLAALFLSPVLATEDLLELAAHRRSPGAPAIETFSPLYLTNECDAECTMCGMRSFNDKLQRETATEQATLEQLDILHRRGLRGVALLTGEYRHGSRRREMLARTATALSAALTQGFSHILINVGSLETDEYDSLLEGVPREGHGRIAPQVTMCTFQETYDPCAYGRFMGTNPENPRSDFQRRLSNFDRAADAGFWSANPGVLLGLNPDLAYEMLALLEHVRHLLARDMTVYMSLPRLRKASGAVYSAGVGDDELTRLVSVLSAGIPEAKVVISTRETPEIQRRLLPVIGVLTPGSPGVSPYTEAGARFEVEASQFEVLDHRPIEVILGEFLEAGASIDCYEPPRA